LFAITVDDQAVGSIGLRLREDVERCSAEIGCWLAEDFWGRGIASRALEAFLTLVPDRPLYARVARDNLASVRVLEKCGFHNSGVEVGFANARGMEIEELIDKLG